MNRKRFKNYHIKIGIIMSTLSFSSLATVFVPSSFDKQVRESSGAIVAEYIGKTSKMFPGDEVMTEASFKVIEAAGINSNDISNRNNFKVIYPGGEWNGLVYHIEGAPKFKLGEKSLLLLNKSKHGFHIRSLGLGKYFIKEDESRKKYFQSSIFREHRELGHLSYSEISSIFKKYYGSTLVNIQNELSVFKSKPKIETEKTIIRTTKGRGIASVGSSKNAPNREVSSHDESDENKISIIWFVLLFSFLGAITTLRKKKN